MWASCCDWLCLQPAEGSDPTRPRSYANSAFGERPTPPPERRTACRACGRHLDAPAAERVCADCKENYCNGCSARSDPRPRLCHTCRRFHGNLLQRAELMKLKVKELRDYLHLHRVATHLCREKEELVELILSQQTSPSESPERRPEPTPWAAAVPNADLPDADLPDADLPDADLPDTDFPDVDLRDVDLPDADLPDRTSGADAPQSPPEPDVAEPDRGQDAAGRRASLSDLSGEDGVEELSVRQLKEILARNFVNYKGCCEKRELTERALRLYRDRHAVQEERDGGGGTDDLCRICMDAAVDCVLLECGHMVTCTKCGKRMNECPICRQFVIRAVHVFRS
ncbi:E3 ubiquitin-protein ligase rififylin isoform X2 [Stigmatopora argus]